MSQTLQLLNFPSNNILAQTNVTSDIAAGGSAIPVFRSVDFVSGSVVLAGYLGSNTAELLTATTPANALTVSTTTATTLDHNNGEAISSLFGSSINVYRASDQYGNGKQPDDANFTTIATVPIDPTSSSTSYTDATGSSAYWYKYTFYNLTSTSETAIADSVAVQGDTGNNYCSLDDIRDEAGFTNSPKITDSTIDQKRQASQKEIVGLLEPIYVFPLPQPTNPLVEQVAIKLAAGLLMEAEYMTVAPVMALQGKAKAADARTTLDQLAVKDLILVDAQFNELADPDERGFGGFPDSTATNLPKSEGGDHGSHFDIEEVY